MRDRDLEEPEPVFLWRAACGVCGARWVYEMPISINPYPHGAFCPDCRDRKLMAPGVLHFKPDIPRAT